MPEAPDVFREFTGKVARAAEETAEHTEASLDAPVLESWRTPEEGAEQLYALWRDYNRTKLSLYRAAVREAGPLPKKKGRGEPDPAREAVDARVDNDSHLAHLKATIRARYGDDHVRTAFENTLRRALIAQEHIEPSYDNYEQAQKRRDAAAAHRLSLYAGMFEHRERDPDELTLLDLADTNARIRALDQALETLERETPELAARLSFERLAQYRKDLKRDGFMWTPSRQAYFDAALEHLVIANQNRPLLLYGETGTGKTRLARAVATRLTGQAPYEVGEEAKTDIRPLLGLRSIDADGSFVTYGPLGQAATGKQTSRDTRAGHGGIFYMDEMGGYPPDGLRALIKQLSGRRAGEPISFAAWGGQPEPLAPQFGFIGSTNLPSEKHPDRAELPVEVARELSSFEVDYPPQTSEQPELYEMMLAALMDQNDRIRCSPTELAPAWKWIVDADKQKRHLELDSVPNAGGTLWRFANLVAEIQRSYKGEENVLAVTERDAAYLRTAVLDPGLAISWLLEYRKGALRSGSPLRSFLVRKLDAWSTQKLFPEEDRTLLRKFRDTFALDDDPREPLSGTLLTPEEIGFLSPRVPRSPEALTEAPKPLEARIYRDDGSLISYVPGSAGDITEGTRFVMRTDRAKRAWVFRGTTPAHELVLESPEGIGLAIVEQNLDHAFECVSRTYIERTPDGREVRLDAEGVLKESVAFYTEHALPDLLKALPKEVRIAPSEETRLREALRQGFDRAMLFPSPETQKQSMNQMIAETAEKPDDGLPDTEQYTAPYFSDRNLLMNAETRNRPASKAYLLLYRADPIPAETKGLSLADRPSKKKGAMPTAGLDTVFSQQKWNGFTLPEYLIVQRKEAEARGDHSFDAYSTDAARSQWTWLLDSRVPKGVVNADWYPEYRQVRVGWGLQRLGELTRLRS